MPNSAVRESRLWEIKVADYLGWRQVGGPGNPDIVSENYTCEFKLRAKSSAETLMRQAESHGGRGRVPVVIVKEKGKHLRNAVAMLRLADFKELLEREEAP